MLARGQRPQVVGPEGPSVRIVRPRRELSLLPGPVVDADGHPADRFAPGRPLKREVPSFLDHPRRGGLEPVVRDGIERPDLLAVAGDLPYRHIVAGHEIAREPLVGARRCG